MAKMMGLALSTVQQIWRTHGLAPHRFRQFKLSNDIAFVDKLRDIVGLYINPPAHAVVFSMDKKARSRRLIEPSRDYR